MADEGEQALRIDDFLGDSFGFEMALSYCDIAAFTEHRLGQRAFNVDALGVGLHRVPVADPPDAIEPNPWCGSAQARRKRVVDNVSRDLDVIVGRDSSEESRGGKECARKC